MQLSERQTRKILIDTTLRQCGWTPIRPYDQQGSRDLVALEEHPTASGPADYVLYQHDQPLAIVEAKKVTVGPQNVLKQAQRYAEGLEPSPFQFGSYRVPFAYSTNGKVFWFQDLRLPQSRSRQVARFHTPEALRDLLERDVAPAAEWLACHVVDDPILRHYQREAIEQIERSLLRGKRRALVAMATGTGKTLTAIALLYRLMKSGLARRVLFLVDRRALAAQAVTAFSRFEAEPSLKFDRVYEVYSQRFRREDLEDQRFDPKILPTSYLTNPTLGQTFVYVSTIQRMCINLFGQPGETGWSQYSEEEADAAKLDIPIHAFDVIIADECHRGCTAAETGAWRTALEHFDAIKIGLTATPAAHTLNYFGDIVYRYEYERAVREGYLVDYEPVMIRSEITMHGAFLHPGEEVGLKDRATGQLRFEFLEDQRELPPSELDTTWAAPDRDRKVIKEVVRHLREEQARIGHFPKTLIFAHNDIQHISHCNRLVDLLRDELGGGDALVEKITGSPDVDRPLQRIREFRNRPEPLAVVTVDMLSTGVDIPSLESIVFLRPVKSRILFEQMMGRGTRLCPEISKTHFTAFDAVGVLEYFAQASGFVPDAPAKATRTIAEVVEAIHGNIDRDYNVRVLVRRLQRVAKNVSAEGREMFKEFIPDGDIGALASDLPRAIEEDWSRALSLLRDPDFQELLLYYPRAQQPFLMVAEEDTVSSGYLIRTSDGRTIRPDDYLVEFERYVRESRDQIEALGILLDRPADWRTDTLRELRRTLDTHPQRFTEENLRKAYHHELADIISIVKHAALGDPLLSAEERVHRAIARLAEGRSFTPDQNRWLDLVRAHLIANLAIEPDDFRLITFSRAGASWARVNRDFGGDLEQMLTDVNEAMAAA